MTDLPIRDDFYTVDKRESVRKVQGTIQGDRDDVPILVDDGVPFGVLNERGMVQSRIDLNEKLADYAVGTKVLSPDSSVDEAVRVALTSGLRWVPVVDDGEAVGVVAADDLLVAVLEEEGGDVIAWELAKEGVLLEEGQTLGEAIRAFREEAKALHVLPVVDDQGFLAGALARRAVIEAQQKTHDTGDRGMRKTSSGEQPGPQDSRSDWPVEGLADAHYEDVDPEDGPDRVADVIGDFGFAFVAAGRRAEGVVTGLTGLRALRG